VSYPHLRRNGGFFDKRERRHRSVCGDFDGTATRLTTDVWRIRARRWSRRRQPFYGALFTASNDRETGVEHFVNLSAYTVTCWSHLQPRFIFAASRAHSVNDNNDWLRHNDLLTAADAAAAESTSDAVKRRRIYPQVTVITTASLAVNHIRVRKAGKIYLRLTLFSVAARKL